jgi:hypothetical protein
VNRYPHACQKLLDLVSDLAARRDLGVLRAEDVRRGVV